MRTLKAVKRIIAASVVLMLLMSLCSSFASVSAQMLGDDAVKTIRAGLTAQHPKIKVGMKSNSSLQDVMLNVKDTLYELMNEKEYFYVTDDISIDASSRGNNVTIMINVKYSNTTAAEKKKFYKAVDDIMKGVDKDWTDIQKAAYLHDKVVLGTDYLDSSHRAVGTPYAALVERKAFCTGYTRAYAILLNECGIASKAVYNDTHGWNLVRLGSHWYHVDCTFDDALINNKPIPYYVSHHYFLRSDSALKDHPNYDKRRFKSADSAKYDKIVMGDISPLAFYGKKIYFIEGGFVYSYDTEKGKLYKLFDVKDKWSIDKGNMVYEWTGNFAQLAQNGKDIYFNLNRKIKKYDAKTGKISVVYELKDTSMTICGINVKDGVLYAYFTTDPNLAGRLYKIKKL